MIRIRLKGLAVFGTNTIEGLKELTGYQLVRDGDDYVVYDNDPRLKESTPAFLTVGAMKSLSDKDASAFLAKAIASAETKYLVSPPSSLSAVGDLGFLTRLDMATRPFFFAPVQQLEDVIATKVLPLVSELGAIHACHVSVDIDKFYTRVAFSKLTFLIGQFDAEAEKAIFDRKLLSGVVPTPFEPHELFHALILFPPYAAAIPLHRAGTSLIFFQKKFFRFHYRLFQSLVNYLTPERGHLQARGRKTTFAGQFNGMSKEFIGLVESVTNEYWDFFTRPMAWLDKDGVFDHLRQIKAMSLGRLLVADLQAIQRTSSGFGEVRLAFQFFDKFAGLCVAYKGGLKQQTESDWASYFLHPAMIRLAADIFKYHGRNNKNKKVASLLQNYTNVIGTSVENDLQAMHDEAGLHRSHGTDAQCIRLIRNLAHGTFLSGGKFEKLLLKITPVAPVEMAQLPWVYLLAFGINPKYFLEQSIKAMESIDKQGAA